MIIFKHPEIITYKGEPVNDMDTFSILPDYLKEALKELNGFSLRNNIYHIRGCVHSPCWHSLKEVWKGETRLTDLFDAIKPDDIPIAQDCTGNQFVIREDRIHMLDVQKGTIVDWKMDFPEFLNQISEFSYDELTNDNIDGIKVEPGQVYSFYPLHKKSFDFSLKPFDSLKFLRLQSEITREILMDNKLFN